MNFKENGADTSFSFFLYNVYNRRMTVHLHVRSAMSLLESTIRIKELVNKAVQCGYTTLALTDHNVMHGTAAFVYACKAAGIHPIIGLEADCLYHEEIVPFLLLAKDNTGYRNLMRLSSILSVRGKPCTTEELIAAKNHCFLIAYGEGGWCDGPLVKDDRQEIIQRLTIMKQELGTFDIALSFEDSSLWKNRNAILRKIASSLSLSCCALNKIYYLNETDAQGYRALCALRNEKKLNDTSLPLIKGRYFLSQEEMEKLYDHALLMRTEEIASACHVDLAAITTSLPDYPVPDGLTYEQYLTQLALAGLKKRLGGHVEESYVQRLRYELSIIVKMHFESYFLIVYDYIRYAKKKGILVGPGRGSAAGSLVAYCLGITDVDPLNYGLLFERFLNPERVSMPDIDTDFPDERRAEVIAYVKEKYGTEHTGGIIAFQTMGARAAIRDAARVHGLFSNETEVLLKAVGTGNETLREKYKTNSKLKRLVDSERKFSAVFATAVTFEGLPRNASVHPAGIVFSRLPLVEVVPLSQGEDLLISQYEAPYLEERGLIKMDFLSLRNLSVIDGIIRKIRKDNPQFDIHHISFDDPQIYQVFARGDTTGIFQFEAEDMKRILRRMRPEKFNDVVAANALRRPGASAHIDEYIENQRHPEKIRWLSESLKPVLQDTYGIMIYQEQAMLASRIVAGFSLGKADVLRKAISKKNESELVKLKKDFMRGALHNHYSEEKAEEIWQVIEQFGTYGFNKSHAVAYTMVSCQLAYLKAHYPLYFYQALLSSVTGDQRKTAQYVDECRHRGIVVERCDVNLSSFSYTIENKSLRMPLSAIKDTGSAAAKKILDEREENGPYKDYVEFVARVDLVSVSRRTIEALIHGGALDGFGLSRATMLAGLDECLNYAGLVRVKEGDRIRINPDLVSKPVFVRIKDKLYERNLKEKEVLGFVLGSDITAAMRHKYHIDVPGLSAFLESHGETITSFGMISSVREITSRNNRRYCRMVLTDGLTDITVGLWPSDYQKYKDQLVAGSFVRFDGKMNENGYIQADRLELFEGNGEEE